jgi:hypothetical protein
MSDISGNRFYRIFVLMPFAEWFKDLYIVPGNILALIFYTWFLSSIFIQTWIERAPYFSGGFEMIFLRGHPYREIAFQDIRVNTFAEWFKDLYIDPGNILALIFSAWFLSTMFIEFHENNPCSSSFSVSKRECWEDTHIGKWVTYQEIAFIGYSC